uniref:KIB1-4 beta-propeller domain-containing protein n=1 Tax=Leersia perrieri TaxID=77586 RepID=A0A0D9XMM0_9ORYZ
MKIGKSLCVCGVGLVSISTVVICLRPRLIAIAKPSDERWKIIDGAAFVDSALTFQGRFYCTPQWAAHCHDQGRRPQLLTAAVAARRSNPPSGSLHLVDNGGDLMVVHRMMIHLINHFEVYRVDLDNQELILAKGFRARAVFMGMHRAVSLLPAQIYFPSLLPDTLYLGFDCEGPIRGYIVKDGSGEPCRRRRYRSRIRERITTLSNSRDWSSLGGEGPAGVIADCVLANDVADFIRFRAVCLPWRLSSSSIDPLHALDPRFLPRHWIMLDNRRFLNVTTGEQIHTEIPEISGDGDHTLLALTPEGLLLLLHEETLILQLLNPLTRRLTDLPPVNSLLSSKNLRDWRSGKQIGKSLHVGGVGIASISTVVVCLQTSLMAIAKPGDDRWIVIAGMPFVDSALTFQGRFYCTVGKNLMVLDHETPQLLIAAARRSNPPPPDFFCSLHLVDNGGELMLVNRMIRLIKVSRMEEGSHVAIDEADQASVVRFGRKMIAIAKPGDESWTNVIMDDIYFHIDSALSFAGRFYCAVSSIYNHGAGLKP